MQNRDSLYYVERNGNSLGPFTQQELLDLQCQSALENDMIIKRADTGETVSLDRLRSTPPPALTSQPVPSIPQKLTKPQNEERHDFVTIEIGSMDIFEQNNLAHFGLFLIGFAFLLDLRGLNLPRIIYPMIGTVSSLIFFYNAYKFWKYGRLVTDIPTSKARSAAIGLVEISGKAVPIYDLYSISCTKCIFYKFKVVHLDGGKEKSTTTSNYIAAPFYMEDATGKILVNPQDAQVGFSYSRRSQSSNWGRVIPYGYGMNYIEYLVVPGETLHIIGRVATATRPDGTQYRVIEKGAINEPFLIFRENEIRLLKRFKADVMTCLIYGLILLIICLILFKIFLLQPFQPLVQFIF